MSCNLKIDLNLSRRCGVLKIKDERTRNWTFELYLESMLKDSFQILSDFHVPAIVSPLHDKDIKDLQTGELKKAHYHIMLCFSGPKSYDNVISLVSVLGVSYVERVHEATALVRYFAHLDETDPRKYHYPVSEFRAFGGVDLYSYLQPTKAQVHKFIADMQEYVKQYRVFEFCDLMDYAKDNYRDTWYYALCSCCANIMTQYIKSFRNKNLKRISD